MEKIIDEDYFVNKLRKAIILNEINLNIIDIENIIENLNDNLNKLNIIKTFYISYINNIDDVFEILNSNLTKKYDFIRQEIEYQYFTHSTLEDKKNYLFEEKENLKNEFVNQKKLEIKRK